MGQSSVPATIDKIAARSYSNSYSACSGWRATLDPSMSLTAASVRPSSCTCRVTSRKEAGSAQAARQSLRVTAASSGGTSAAWCQRREAAREQRQRQAWRCSSVVDGAGASMTATDTGSGVEPGEGFCRLAQHPPLIGHTACHTRHLQLVLPVHQQRSSTSYV